MGEEQGGGTPPPTAGGWSESPSPAPAEPPVPRDPPAYTLPERLPQPWGSFAPARPSPPTPLLPRLLPQAGAAQGRPLHPGASLAALSRGDMGDTGTRGHLPGSRKSHGHQRLLKRRAENGVQPFYQRPVPAVPRSRGRGSTGWGEDPRPAAFRDAPWALITPLASPSAPAPTPAVGISQGQVQSPDRFSMTEETAR